jgi:DNA polymerase/3'-5' exonuclease PolX
MLLEEALPIAEHVRDLLAPHCDRIEIGGSIRRGKQEVKDIEIIAIPKPYEVGLFSSGIAEVVNQWPKVKGELPCKYTQRILPEGIKLDLFMCDANNWGLILALRTGPADWNQHWLLPKLSRVGLVMREGRIWRGQDEVFVRSEETLFRIIHSSFIAPEHRTV